jgi:DNA-binding HxlR family transcriptional regulator
MSGFGQFCPLALATEIVGERWTPLVLRELMLGSRRFNDIHRGVPRMSPSLLVRRLLTLEKAGIVTRQPMRRGHVEYSLTEAGSALAPIIESLALWGRTFLPATLSRDNADPDLVMWDLHRRMDLCRMPAARTVMRFEFTDQPREKRYRWIVGNSAGVELCITDPGLDIDLHVTTDSRTMTWVWYGDLPLKRALADGTMTLDGPRRLREAFPSWLLLNLLAGVQRRHPLGAGRPPAPRRRDRRRLSQ